MRASLAVSALLVLLIATPAIADPKQVKPDRRAINRLLDAFVPDVVEQRDLRAGWKLSGGYTRMVSFKDWIDGNTSIERFPAKGTTFHGWTLNYSYPGDVGFDILLQPSSSKLGAISYRAEAQKLRGRWRITTWYTVAQFAAPGQLQHVSGPADFSVGATFVGDRSARRNRLGWFVATAFAAFCCASVAAFLARGRRRARR